MNKRIPWPEYFMNIAYLVAERSTCLRRKVGALAVKDKRILATGYNGAPAGLTHCLDIGCLREQLGIPSGQRHELCRSLHAEQNVIIQAALHGVSMRVRIFAPRSLVILRKMLINCRIKHLFLLKAILTTCPAEWMKRRSPITF